MDNMTQHFATVEVTTLEDGSYQADVIASDGSFVTGFGSIPESAVVHAMSRFTSKLLREASRRAPESI